MKRVYIAHPLRNDVPGNIAKVTEICRQLWAEQQVIPLSPLHAFGFAEPTGDQFHAMQCCFALLDQADELHVYGEWWESEGCQAEICYAKCRRIPIRFKEGTGFESIRGCASAGTGGI
jgi:hypothetical protein